MAIKLDHEISNLSSVFIEMGLTVSEQLYLATAAFLHHDHDKAQMVVDNDKAINEDELHLEKLSLRVLVLQQPVATDFRDVMSILKSSVDLERMGDHAVDIARETLALTDHAQLPEADELLSQMVQALQTMLEQILDAYIKADQAKAKQVAVTDLEVDRDFAHLRQLLTKVVEADPQKAELIASYLFVSRLLERAGDHVVNIAEWIVYQHTGKLVELNIGKADRRQIDAQS